MAQYATDQNETEEIEIKSEHIVQMTEDLFVAMLAMDLCEEPQAEPEFTAEALQATVRVSGSWGAELRVVASPNLAQSIACAMFGMEPSELSEEETQDALGEVANVIGGNIKGMFDRDCNLSLPCVGPGPAEVPERALCGAFRCNDSILHVILVTD